MKIESFASFLDELLESVSEIFVKNTTYLNFVFLENELISDSKVSPRKEEPFVTFQLWKVKKKNYLISLIRRNDRNKDKKYSQ